MSTKQALNDKLHGSVAAYFRCSGVVNNQIKKVLPGERDNARNNARCTQARKTTHGLDGHQDVDRTPRGRVNQSDRGQR